MTGTKRRGWCPSALKPMPTGDGLLMRLRAPMGRLSLVQAQGLAEAAVRHGKGVIDLTSRANLQVRGLTEASHQALIGDLARLELLDPDHDSAMLPELPCTLIASPFAEPAGLLPLRAALEARLRSETRLEGLPPKFCIVLDERAAPWFDDIPAHLRILVAAKRDSAMICGPDGAEATLADVPERVLMWALASVNISRAEGKAGEAVLPAALGGALAAKLSVGARTSPEGLAARPVKPRGAGSLLGPFTHMGRWHAGLGVSFGSMQAHALTGLVSALRRAGVTEVRLTPWHMLIAPAIDASAMPRLVAAARSLGFIVAGDDPRHAVSACVGKPACAGAYLPASNDAMHLAQAIGTGLRQRNMHVHISGCEKGCARPSLADFTLWATPQGYILHDKAPETPIPTIEALSVAAAAARIAVEIG